MAVENAEQLVLRWQGDFPRSWRKEVRRMIATGSLGDLRDDKVDDSITEDETDQFRTTVVRLEELPSRENEDKKVEGHGVDECSREERCIGPSNDASLARNPCGLEKNAYIGMRT